MTAKSRSNEYPIGGCVIADALWFELDGKRWTLYLLLFGRNGA